MSFVISIDGACDIDYAQLSAFSVKVRKFLFRMNRTEPVPDKSMLFSEHEQLLSRILNGESLYLVPPHPHLFDDFFDKILETGNTQILHLCSHSSLSSSFDFAQKSAIKSMIKFPKAQVFVFDTLTLSAGMQPFLEKAIALRDQGFDAGEAFVQLCELKNSVSTYLATADISTLVSIGIAPLHARKGENISPLYLYNIGEKQFSLLSRHKGEQSLAKKINALGKGAEKAFVSLTTITEPTASLIVPTQISNMGLFATSFFGAKATVVSFLK